MKNITFLKKRILSILLCSFAILSSHVTSAQNGSQSDNQEIQRIRALTRTLSEILPDERVASASNALTPAEKTNFQFIKKTIFTGTQIPDNPTKASLLNYKAQLAKALDLLWVSPPNPNGGTNSSAKKNNSSAMGKSIWEKFVYMQYDPCTRKCLENHAQGKEDCVEKNQVESDQIECKIKVGEICIACIKACKSNTKH